MLNRLARINVRGTKNLQYIDLDTEINQEIKPELATPSWLTLPPEKFTARIFIFAILSFLIYVLLSSFSRVLVQLGNAEFSAGHDRIGTASYNLALALNGNLKEASERCIAARVQGQYELAISYCSKAIEIDSNFATAYFNRGIAYMLLKNYDQAIADFSKDVEIIPVATRSYINRGTVYMDQQKYDSAIADFTKSISVNPKEPQAYLDRGLTYLQQGQTDLAITDCNKAIELESKYWNAYLCLGSAFTNQGEYELAITNFDKALELAPSAKTSLIYCIEGVTYTKMGDFESAVTSFEEGVEIDVADENDWCRAALDNARQGIPTP